MGVIFWLGIYFSTISEMGLSSEDVDFGEFWEFMKTYEGYSQRP